MAIPIGVWGIDIGQCALKALRMEMIDGKPTATGYDFIEHAKILSQPDADPEALTREALEKFFSRNPIGKDEIAISIPGQSGLVRFVKLPPVEEKKIPDIVKFEAKQQIPFPLEEVVWDFQKIGGGETVGGFAMETEIGLFAMKRDIISKYLGHYVGTGGEVHYVQMAPLALCNFATYELLKKGGADAPPPEETTDDTPRGKKRCVVVLDIGTDSSNLIITDGGKIIWQRPVPLGGSHFTRALTKEMKLTFAKAEHLKRNAAKSPDLAQILRALRPVLTEFVGEVQRSLGFFTNTHRDSHIAYLVGLGSAFKLPGLQKYLAEKLSLDVRKPAKFDRIVGDSVLGDPNFADNMLTFPIAYGLALQGLGQSRLLTNLLPGEVRTDRMIRAKKPAVAAATAAFLAGVAIFALGSGSQLSAVNDKSIAAADDKGKAAITSATAQETEFNGKKTGIETGQSEIKAIVVGNDERLNWVRMQEVLSAVLPRPGYINAKTGEDDGKSNLYESFKLGNGTTFNQRTFWDTDGGRRAFEKYRERLSSGIPLEKILDDDQSQYLAMVNLETVYCRYVPDVKAFYEAADRFVNDKFTRDIADDMIESESEVDEASKRKKPKVAFEGTNTGGWVFELRGYTYHKDTNNFVKRALLRNVQRFGAFAEQGNPTKRVDSVIAGAADPVGPVGEGDAKKPSVSHAFLMVVGNSATPTLPTSFTYINTSYVDPLVGGTAGGGMAGPGGPMGPTGGDPGEGRMSGPGASGSEGGAGGAAATGSVAPPWSPLLSGGTAGGAGGFGGSEGGMGRMSGGMSGGMSAGGGMGGIEGGSMPPPGGMPGMSGMMPGMSGMMPGSQPVPAPPVGKGATAPKPRTEFVLCFVWREPTPTDPTPTGVTP
jgi:type IV pilus assembly protein PilM